MDDGRRRDCSCREIEARVIVPGAPRCADRKVRQAGGNSWRALECGDRCRRGSLARVWGTAAAAAVLNRYSARGMAKPEG